MNTTTANQRTADRQSTGVAGAGRRRRDRDSTRDRRRPLPFAVLVRVELRKSVDTRGGRWILAVIVMLTLLAIGSAMWLSRSEGASFDVLLLASTAAQGVLLPLLGILTVCSEWSQRTALVTFTQEPRRVRVMGAKAVAAVLLGFVVLVVSLVLAAGAHLLSTAWSGGAPDLSLSLASAVDQTLLQTINVLQGVAFGALALRTSTALVALFLVPTIVSLASISVTALERHSAWLDAGSAMDPLFGADWPTRLEWQHLAGSLVLWLVVPGAVGLWRIARREVV